ncbi:MAG: hypothetical protein NXI00_22775 [Cytophagales bacterium]|nr:hypothetical protein [Cytophagales bacterium]
MRLIIAMSIATIVMSSCGTASKLMLEKSPEHRKEAKQITKVVTIDPEYSLVYLGKGADDYYLKSEKKEDVFTKTLTTSASKAGIELVVVDKESLKPSDLNYFNYLAPLKQQILIASTLQDVTLKKTRYGENGRNWIQPDYKEFKEVPIFTAEYSHLSDKYGTPYFAFHGMLTVVEKRNLRPLWFMLYPVMIPYSIAMVAKPNAHTYYYNVIVNVETSEVLFREIRYIKRKPANSLLQGITYDSFRILSKPSKK